VDPVGFAIGVVGLAGLASTCIDAFHRATKLDEDHGVLQARLAVQRDRFKQWAQRAGLLGNHHTEHRSTNRNADRVAHRLLLDISRSLRGIAYLEDGTVSV
jgi:hypothetical protein